MKNPTYVNKKILTQKHQNNLKTRKERREKKRILKDILFEVPQTALLDEIV